MTLNSLWLEWLTNTSASREGIVVTRPGPLDVPASGRRSAMLLAEGRTVRPGEGSLVILCTTVLAGLSEGPKISVLQKTSRQGVPHPNFRNNIPKC